MFLKTLILPQLQKCYVRCHVAEGQIAKLYVRWYLLKHQLYHNLINVTYAVILRKGKLQNLTYPDVYENINFSTTPITLRTLSFCGRANCKTLRTLMVLNSTILTQLQKHYVRHVFASPSSRDSHKMSELTRNVWLKWINIYIYIYITRASRRGEGEGEGAEAAINICTHTGVNSDISWLTQK